MGWFLQNTSWTMLPQLKKFQMYMGLKELHVISPQPFMCGIVIYGETSMEFLYNNFRTVAPLLTKLFWHRRSKELDPMSPQPPMCGVMPHIDKQNSNIFEQFPSMILRTPNTRSLETQWPCCCPRDGPQHIHTETVVPAKFYQYILQ